MLKRERGTFCFAGSSQAMAFTSTTCCGGKSSGTSAARLVGEALEAEIAEALSPFADDLPGQIEFLPDGLVVEPVSGQQDELGTDDLGVRRRVAPGHRFEVLSLLFGEEDDVGAG